MAFEHKKKTDNPTVFDILRTACQHRVHLKIEGIAYGFNGFPFTFS